MAIEKLPHADVAERSGYQCGMVHPELGRCALSSSNDDHHVVKRSEGGSDDPENRVMVCKRHHDQIHGQQRPPMFRVLLGGNYCYAEDTDERGPEYLKTVMIAHGRKKSAIDELTSRDYDVWLLWPDVSEAWEKRYLELRDQVDSFVDGAHSATWGLAGVGFELERGRLYTLEGYEDIGQFALSHRLKPATFKCYINAERRLRRIVPEREWPDFREIPCSLWHKQGRALEAGGLALARDLLEAVRSGVPGPALTTMLAEGKDSAENVRRRAVTVRCEKVVFTFHMPHEDVKDAREAAITRLIAMGSLDSYTVSKIEVGRPQEV